MFPMLLLQDLPTLYVLPPSDGQHMRGLSQPSLTAGYCKDIYDRWDGESSYTPLGQMGTNMDKGMVLAMSTWYAQETYANGKPEGTQTGMHGFFETLCNTVPHYV